SGGFVGRTVEAEVDLAADDDRAAEVRGLLGRVGALPERAAPPHPDGFTYELDVDGRTGRFVESDLTDDLRRLVDVVLRDPGSGSASHS
ncbi:protealysin inhibitor emfourin, partial [Nocardioides sp.]|uniref:protealysin inhibitor emfourin n=1 Tax=Nocardioides sp. TaxID=35761 RepID=UPI002720F59D|nr:hypothetical protein [Nocardioides sp.]